MSPIALLIVLCFSETRDLCLKGHCHGLTCAEFESAKTHFTATETYKYRSSFDKNYDTSVIRLKKSSLIGIPPGAQNPNLKKSAGLFQVLPPWQCPFKPKPVRLPRSLFFAAVNHLSGPRKEQQFTSTGSKDRGYQLWMVDFNPFCLFLFIKVRRLSP